MDKFQQGDKADIEKSGEVLQPEMPEFSMKKKKKPYVFIVNEADEALDKLENTAKRGLI